jgi:hypothetical protein
MLVASILVAAAAAATAQQPQHDPRWEAWYGCWMAAEGAAQSPTGRAPTVCVIPAGGGVDVATVLDTTVVARDHIEVLAERHPVSREGCTGWETASWSSQGDRLYRRSEYTCPGDVKRTTSDVFAMTPSWEWLDVQGLALRGSTGVRVLRYHNAVVPAVPEIATALAAHLAEISMARAAAALPPGTSDVIEASRAADPSVVEAWLAEEGEGFPLTGKQLLALSDSGVPGPVIDVMVAMTYPKVFTVAAPSARGGFNGAEASPRAPAPDTMYANRPPYYGSGLYGPPSPWGWDYYSPWSWSLYGYYSPYFYSPYGQFSPYAYGGYGGYYYGGGTVVVVSGGGNDVPQPHGQYVKGHGYQHGSGDTSGSRPGTYRDSGASSSSGAASAPASSSGQSSGSSGSSGSSSQVGQHAHPKP